jgi:hypothetical protein
VSILKELGKLFVALAVFAAILWRIRLDMRATQPLPPKLMAMRHAILNAKRITIVVDGKPCPLDTTSDPAVLESFRDALDYGSRAPASGIRPTTFLMVDGVKISYVQGIGEIGGDSDGEREWFTLQQPARGKIARIVAGMRGGS